MKRVPALVAAALAMTAPAFASDPIFDEPDYFSPVPVSDWTGLYVGIHGGYGWGRGDQDVTFDALGFLDTDGAAINISGGFIGGTVGFNYQVDSFVFGVEGDLALANISGYTNPDGDADNDGYETRLDWLGSVRARAGYALDSFMIYGTVGIAAAGTSVENGDVDGDVFDPLTGTASTSYLGAGWVVGAGVEMAVMDNISVKAEYNYYNFGTQPIVAPTSTAVGDEQAELTSDIHVLMLGVNYSF